LALKAYWDFAVVADADAGLQAPNIRPPRAGWRGTQDGTVLSQGLSACAVRRGAQFAVDFVFIGMRQELVQQVVGANQLDNRVGGQQRRQALLPVVVAALDFAFGLRGWGVASGVWVKKKEW
jgi:hypothetical protein